MKCTGRTKAGKPCGRWALSGATVCPRHGGAAPQVKAKAAIRAEVAQWVPGSPMDDPGELMMRLMTQSRMRADGYAQEMQRVISLHDTLSEALVGDSVVVDQHGGEHKAGEYVRGLVQIEAQERDRAFGFAAKAVAAGLREREVRILERQAALFSEIIRGLIRSPEWGLSQEQQEVGLSVAARIVRGLPTAA